MNPKVKELRDLYRRLLTEAEEQLAQAKREKNLLGIRKGLAHIRALKYQYRMKEFSAKRVRPGLSYLKKYGGGGTLLIDLQ